MQRSSSILLTLEETKPLPRKMMESAKDLSSANAMWRSVLAQAIRDIYGSDLSPRLEVIRWLQTKDFETVCEFAHVEPMSMREQLMALIELPTDLARKYGKLLRDKVMEGLNRSE